MNPIARKATIRFPLFWQFMLAMSVLVCLTTASVWVYVTYHLNDILTKQADIYATALTQQAANSAAELVMANDQIALVSMLDNLVGHTKSLEKISVFNHQNQLLSRASQDGSGLQSRDYQADILYHDVVAGRIEVSIDHGIITQSIQQLLTILSIITLTATLLAILIAVVIAQSLSAPLKHLQKVAQVVADGELNPLLPDNRNDEVGDLILSFKKMLKSLRDKESIEHKFSSYISKDIAKDILADLGRDKKPLKTVNGSVLFVDIVGFTQLCETQSANEIADILNQYYFLLHQAAKMYRGSVDNYIGDGGMLTFGVHKNDQKHAINAVCAAQIFIRLTDIMNSQRTEKKLIPLQFRLGIHSGELLAGTIGSSERMQFSISGDTVNLASRLCELATPGQLLISEATYCHSSCEGLLITNMPLALSVKGKSNTTTTYQVKGLAAKFNRLLMQQEAEMLAMDAHE